MPERDAWLLAILAGALSAAAMAMLVTGIALVLGTTGHDWYAAWKLTLVEAMLAVGFDPYETVSYTTADGAAVTVERYRLVYVMHEAWRARGLILFLVADRAVLGACTGLALYALWLGARVAAACSRRLRGGMRGAAVEPAARVRPGYAGPVRHPDAWSESELVAALARRSGRLGVLLLPAGEVERLTGGHGEAAGRPATPPESLAPPPAPALPPADGAEQGGGEADETRKAVSGASGPRRAERKKGKAGSGRKNPGRQFF